MSDNKINYLLGLTRIAMGWIFLWAFLDKAFGLGFATLGEKAWIAGGSPTNGFLGSTEGYFAFFYHALAGNFFVDGLFMVGLLLIGLSLILGIFNKLATYSGSLLLLLMFFAVIPLKNNPIIDDHIIYILVLFLLNSLKAGNYIGFRKEWIKTNLVQRIPFFE